MHLGFARLRLTPDAFWRMTPRELAAAAGSCPAPAVPARADLADLLAAFPDRG